MKFMFSVIFRCLFIVTLFFVSTSVSALECSSEQISLSTQAEVDGFQMKYGPCDLVRGSLTISGEDILDLQPLSGLVEIRGDLSIRSNANLTTLTGLSGLTLIYTLAVADNDKLSDLVGLGSLENISVGLRISRNNLLKTLEGMPSLDTVGLFLQVDANPELATLWALRQARFLYDAEIQINANGALRNLSGIPSTSRVDRLELVGNEALTDVSGLRVADGTLVGRVSIQQNPSLRNLAGMEWLMSAHNLTVSRNPRLIDFTGLSELTSAEMISIEENDALRSVDGLENLRGLIDLPEGMDADSSFVGRLWIRDNSALENVDALSALTASGDIFIIENTQLMDCSGLMALLDVVDHDMPGPGPGESQVPDSSGSVNLSSNGSGCNAIADIAPRPDVARTLTGSWYDPASSGEGFMIHAVKEHIPVIIGVNPGQEGLAVGYFYGYDENGERFWLIGTHQGPMNWGEAIEFTTTEVSGGSFEGFDSTAIIRSDWGTFSFLPANCVAGTITMQGEFSGQSGVHEKTLNVVRLANVSGDYCSNQISSNSTDSMSGSWYDPITSGQGFAIHKIDDERGIVYFYGFDRQQAPLWLIGVWTAPLVLGEAVEIEMTRASGGTFSVVNPDEILRETWGTLLLRLDDCFSASAELVGLDGEQFFVLSQLAGSLSLDCTGETDLL